MKKIFLSLALLLGSVATFANQLTVLSFSSCNFFVHLYDGGGDIYVTNGFSATYADPSAVPNSTAPPTATFHGAAIQRDYFPDGFAVGTAPTYQQYFNSSFINDFPACSPPAGYDVYWNVNPLTGNIVLLIM